MAAVDDATPDWTALVAERKIREAMDAGEFENLEGEGKPLNLEEGSLDAGQYLLNKLLKNSGAVPEWIQLQKDLQREIAELAPSRERGLRAIRFARNEPSRVRTATRARSDYRDRLRLINDLILKYNMIVPLGAQQVFAPYAVDREMARLDAEVDVLTRAPDTAPSAVRTR